MTPGASCTASTPRNQRGGVLVHSYADSQNAYAALLQATSACTVAPNGDNRPLVNLGFSNEGLGAGESVIDLKVGKER